MRGRYSPTFMLAGLIVAFQGVASAQETPVQGVSPRATIEQAIALLVEARRHFQDVQDYECRLVKRERVNGTLMPDGVMTMKVRSQPFSIYLRGESPSSENGLEVCYVDGRNDGKMRVHPTGMRSVLGFWSVDPHDPRAFETNRHCITEAGLGNLLESTARYWETERTLNKTLVRINDEEFCGRPCTRIETIHSDRNAGVFYGYRCRLWLDRATHFPVGAETYDWPRQPGSDEGDLLESYRYEDLHVNVGLDDATFSH